MKAKVDHTTDALGAIICTLYNPIVQGCLGEETDDATYVGVLRPHPLSNSYPELCYLSFHESPGRVIVGPEERANEETPTHVVYEDGKLRPINRRHQIAYSPEVVAVAISAKRDHDDAIVSVFLCKDDDLSFPAVVDCGPAKVTLERANEIYKPWEGQTALENVMALLFDMWSDPEFI